MNTSELKPNDSRKCPQCGTILPRGALEGLCPGCLLKQASVTDTAPPEAIPFDPPSIEEVARLFPHLEILAFIGKGGMGAVYKARQPVLDRLVALKILPAQALAGPGSSDRFNMEARALAKLNHPNIVAVYEFGQINSQPFLIMEFVDGLNLRQLERTGQLSSREALQIVPRICEALQFAHDEGIVHRDIKPENILVDKKGRVKIADFGIAKIMGTARDTFATETKYSMGTPHYMAPEQIEKPSSVDHRADIFSLGVVFYEMLTGDLPLGKFDPPSHKAGMDSRLDEVVLRALENQPERRYQQAEQMKTAVVGITESPVAPGNSKEELKKASSSVADRGRQFPGKPQSLLLKLKLPIFALTLLIMIIGWNFAVRRATPIPKVEPRETRLDENRVASEWSPAIPPDGKPDLNAIRAEAAKLTSMGRYDEALQRYLWYHKHALEYGESDAVRLSFGLSDWVELARRYPPARQALLDLRDRDVRDFAEGRGFFDKFMEVSSINSYLHDDDATLALFESIRQKDPQLASLCFNAIEELLVKRGKYELCSSYIANPLGKFDLILSARGIELNAAQKFPGQRQAQFRASAEKRFVDRTGQLLEVLLATGKKAEAAKILERATAVSDDPRLKSAIEDAESRIFK